MPRIIAIIFAAISLCGCATNIKGIGYLSDSQICHSLFKITPKGISSKEALTIISQHLKSNKEEIVGYHKESRQISVYLGEYFEIPFPEDVDATWHFSQEDKLDDISIGRSYVAF